MKLRSTTTLSDSLSWGLLSFPQLIDELPMMIISLDQNEYVKISSIKNSKLQTYLTSLMKILPVEESAFRGWSRSNPDESVAKFIRATLLKEGTVKLPRELTNANSTAFRFGSSRVMHLLQAFPELRGELSSFLSNILDGNNVQLDGLENESVREELEKMLKSVGMEYDEDECIGLPEGPGKEAASAVLRHLLATFEGAERHASLTSPEAGREHVDEGDTSKVSRKRTRSDSSSSSSDRCSSSSSSSSSSSGDSESEAESEREPATATGRSVGPTLPSTAQLIEARRWSEKYAAQGSIEDRAEDEAEFGPSVAVRTSADREYLSRPVVASSFIAPIGVPLELLEALTAPRPGAAEEKEDGPQGREEWMMTPGQNKSIADIYEAMGTLSNRKFQTGKGAKKLAEAYSSVASELAIANQQKDSRVGDDTEAEAEAEDRGPSLMEVHLEGRKAVKQAAPEGRLSFDRERDLLSRKKMDHVQAAKLVENARQLDSRFDKGSKQTRFF